MLKAVSHHLVDQVEPLVARLGDAGLWISADIKQRILVLAGEAEP